MVNFGKMDYWGDSIPYRPQELSYIKQVPLPIKDSPKESTIKARCMERMTILEPSIPTREQTRKLNYDRRQNQMNNRGFVSLKQEPYKAIGHPVYIDNKRLITDALGLPKEEEEDEMDKASTPPSSVGHVNKAESTYMMRRSRKQLNTLSKEVVRGRNLLRNVKLGQGLFEVLQDEWNKTKSRRELDEAIAKEKAMMNWQLAHIGSDSESGSDSDLDDEIDITKEFVQIDAPDYSKRESYVSAHGEDRDHVRFVLRPETHNGHTNINNELSVAVDTPARHMSAPALPLRRKKHTPRPYTPVHSNISQKKQQPAEIVGEMLFRQLCCLHWILRAMDLPEAAVMSPIICCWQLNADKMGGAELNKKQQEEKRTKENREYENIFRVPRQVEKRKPKKVVDKRRSGLYPFHSTRPSYRSTRADSYAPSIRSRSGSIAHSLNSETMTPYTENYAAGLDDPRIENDNSIIAEEQSLDSSQSHSLGGQLALANSSLQQPELETIVSSRPPTRQPSVGIRAQLMTLTREEMKQQELAKQLEEAAKMDNTPMERLSHSRMYRATDRLKPKSSKELLEFKTSCRSSKLMNKSKEMREEWAEVKEERALRLHDELDSQEKNRLRTCQDKFSAMSTTSNSFHRALKAMRIMSEHKRREADKEKNKKQDQSKYAKWFDDLTNMVPKEYAAQWYFTAILDKLRTFGITESSSKASEHKFTRVLKLIRSFEICSPNIAAAVEFCRDRIIEMNEDDFEELFQHLFPAIERPKTAPAKSTSSSEKR